MKKQTKDFLFDLLWNVCFSNTLMCDVLQKDYNLPPPPLHTHSLSLVSSFTAPPRPVSIYRSPSLILIWSVGFNVGGLISLLGVWPAAVHALNKQPQRGAPVGSANQLQRRKSCRVAARPSLDQQWWTVCLSFCLSCCLSFYQAFQTE